MSGPPCRLLRQFACPDGHLEANLGRTAVMNSYLFPALESTVDIVGHQFRQLPQSSWDVPTHSDRFTPREVLAHLADWEPILLDRIKAAVLTPGATIEAFDEGQMALDNGYASIEPSASLASFKAARAKTVEFLKSVPHDDWQKTIIHPERGPLSVYDIANMVACHDVYHVKQLIEAKV